MAFIIGAALAIGGGLLSASAQRAKQDALKRIGHKANLAFTQLGDNYGRDYLPVIERYTAERGRNIDMYRAEMSRSREDFTKYFDQARSEYGQGMERAISAYGTGRDDTIAMMRQQTVRQQQQATARNAFTGLGQTSFGQQSVNAIGDQGDMREGAVREQYASGLSNLEAQRASGLSTLSAQQGQGLSALSQNQAANISNMYQAYSGQIANMEQSRMQNQYNLYQQGLNISFKYRGAAAGMAGAYTSAMGSALSSIGGGMMGSGINTSGGGGGGYGGGGLATPNYGYGVQGTSLQGLNNPYAPQQQMQG